MEDKHSHFIVRIPEYIHRLDFPDRCQSVLDSLSGQPIPDHFDDFMKQLSEAVKIIASDDDGFGEIRKFPMNTSLNGAYNYLSCAQRIIEKQYAKDLPDHTHRAVEWQREYFDDSVDPPLELSRVIRNGAKPESPSFLDHYAFQQGAENSETGSLYLYHCLAPETNDEYDKANYHRAMNLLAKNYEQAIGKKPLEQGQTKEDAALHCYYLFSQIMPFSRGSSSAARLMFERLAEVAGFETYNNAPNIDMNIEAISNHWSAFRTNYKAGLYTDKNISAEHIMASHQEWAAEQNKTKDNRSPKNWARLVKRAFELADDDCEAPVISVSDLFLSFMLAHEKNVHAKNIPMAKLHEEFERFYPVKSGYITASEKVDTASEKVDNCIIKLGNVSYQEDGNTHSEPCISFVLERDEEEGIPIGIAQKALGNLLDQKIFKKSKPSGQAVFEKVIKNPNIQITLSGKIVEGEFVEKSAHHRIKDELGHGIDFK